MVAANSLNLHATVSALVAAATLGDALNFTINRRAAPAIVARLCGRRLRPTQAMAKRLSTLASVASSSSPSRLRNSFGSTHVLRATAASCGTPISSVTMRRPSFTISGCSTGMNSSSRSSIASPWHLSEMYPART